MKDFSSRIICLLAFYLSAALGLAQTASIQTVNNVPAGNVSVSIILQDFDNTNPDISSFQWTVQFDANKLTYLNTTTLVPGDGWTVLNPQAGRITFAVVPSASFDANNPVTICNMNFTYNATASAFVNWSDNPTPRHIYDDDLDDYTGIVWVNGSVNPVTVSSPVIITHPAGTSACAGSNSTFSVYATGSPLNYQWQVSADNGTSWQNQADGGIHPVYSGMTSSTMHITGVGANIHNFRYRCCVSNTGDTVCSNAAILIVDTLPAIVLQPSDDTVCPGAVVQFTLNVAGTSPTYLWEYSTDGGANWNFLSNTPPYSGVLTPTLTINGAVAGMDGYQYRCFVDDNCGAVGSDPATLIVNQNLSVVSSPGAAVICEGESTVFSVVVSGTLPSYLWQYSPDAGTHWYDLTNDQTYNNVNTSSLQISNAGISLDGYYYRCGINNVCDSAHTIPAILNVEPIVAINQQPVNSMITEGSNTSFSITTSVPTVDYQWQESTDGGINWSDITANSVYSNETSPTLNITAATLGMNNFMYRCVVSDLCLDTVSDEAALFVSPATALPETHEKISFATHPNPVNDILYVSVSANDLSEIRIFTLTGLPVNFDYVNRAEYDSRNFSVNVSSLLPGIYIIEFTTSEHELVHRKFIKI